MRLLGLVAILAMLAIGLVVCVRMLRLAARTRQLPELAMGGGLLCIMVLGVPLAAVSRMPGVFGTPLGDVLLVSGLLVVDVGIVLMYAFTCSVFRPRDRWARGVLIAVAAVLVPLTWQQLSLTLAGGTADEISLRTRPFSLTYMVLVAAMFVWTGAESLRYFAQMRKRIALGLADPIVANRFLLWGLGGVTAVVMCLGVMAVALQGHNTMQHPAGQIQVAVGTIGIAACWYLAFLPPRAYTDWVLRRAVPAS